MANYVSHCRSSYFPVNDEDVFRAWARARELTVTEKELDDGARGFCLSVPHGSWDICDPTGDESVFVPDEIADHLPDGWTAVFLEVGYEGLGNPARYLVGYAIAVDSDGNQMSIGLDDIYDRVRAAGLEYTNAVF